jgi:steroid delta-isomerase-like uncharacterized protein
MGIEANKAIVRRLVHQGINPANMAVFDELLAQDVLDHTLQPGQPGGREGWKQQRRHFLAAFPDGRWEIADMVAEGELVVTRATFSGTHQGAFFGVPATGRPVVVGSIYTVRIVDGQIVERWATIDSLGLMQQIGAVPAPTAAS